MLEGHSLASALMDPHPASGSSSTKTSFTRQKPNLVILDEVPEIRPGEPVAHLRPSRQIPSRSSSVDFPILQFLLKLKKT